MLYRQDGNEIGVSLLSNVISDITLLRSRAYRQLQLSTKKLQLPAYFAPTPSGLFKPWTGNGRAHTSAPASAVTSSSVAAWRRNRASVHLEAEVTTASWPSSAAARLTSGGLFFWSRWSVTSQVSPRAQVRQRWCKKTGTAAQC